MKAGDLVRVKGSVSENRANQVGDQFVGEVGVVICNAMRLHIHAFKVLLTGGVVEFDHDELELVK